MVGPPGRPRDAVRGRPEGAAHLLEHRQLLHPLRRGQRLGSDRRPLPARAERPLLDRWALAELAQVTAEVTAALEDFDTQSAGRLLAEFVDDLSNWYVRRSRRRFWDGDPAALATLHEVLDGLTRLMAPFTPFVTEEVWTRAVAPGWTDAADSVHLASWPTVDEDARATTTWWRNGPGPPAGRAGPLGPDVGQGAHPPAAGPAVVAAPGGPRSPATWSPRSPTSSTWRSWPSCRAVDGELVDVSLKIDFRAVGRRLGKQVQAVAKAVAAADAAELTAAYRAGTAAVEVDGVPCRWRRAT